VGLVARFLEEAGFSTVTLTNTPEFHRQVGMPRVAGIEYPYGRPVGEVNDQDGQKAVLMETLRFMEGAESPGEIKNLPFTWPEEPKDTQWHPPEISPIVKLFLGEIKKAGSKKRETE
jgi:hypothetical protein